MLQKQAVDFSFAKGLDTKTDPKRVQLGKFVRLENTIFNKGGLLQKRNGFKKLTSLPDTTYSYVTTFNGNLTALGPNIAAFNSANDSWVQKGRITPLSLSTLSLLRNNYNQTMVDSLVAENGLVCTVYLESSGAATTAKYVIADSITGQNIVAPSVIPVISGVVTGGLRVFVVSNIFVIVFTNVISAVSHLQYVTINSNTPDLISTNVDIASVYTPATTLSWDGCVLNSTLYLAYNTTSGGQSIKVTYLSSLAISRGSSPVTPISFASYAATMMSITTDVTNSAVPVIYISFYNLGTTVGYIVALDALLNVIMNPVRIINGVTVDNITSAAQNGTCFVFGEIDNAYSFDSSLPTNYIVGLAVTPLLHTFNSVFSSGVGTITASSATGLVNGMALVDNTNSAHIAAGTTFTISGTTLTLSINTAGNSASSPGDVLTAVTISSSVTIIRSVGLASKAFIMNDEVYFLTAFQSQYQPSYFLVNGSRSTSAAPVVAAKLAYQNGGGYLTLGLPNVTVAADGVTVYIPYRIKDLIQAVNKDTNVPTGTQIAGIYSQTGLNLCAFVFGTSGLDSSEIGNNLHLAGGFLSMYDGYLPLEHNFFLYPDSDIANPADMAVWSTTGGSIVAQPDASTHTNAYYYQFTYEWSDNQGNIFRSAPSVPIPVTTSGTGTTGSVTLKLPCLRVTMKTANPVKIVAYRWSVGQQSYYQVTSVTTPLLSDPTIDSVQFVDTSSDATILGNSLIYTTGGVVEDVNAPATNILTLFDSRLWLVNSEDPNTVWYSKQVIEATPVEMSDLFTLFIPPTTSTQGSTGPITALSAMDDKLIVFKKNAILYISGSGPDNTGANSQYSQAIFITATVGCTNQKSIVLTPEGLLFQSDKGIWLLDRGLGTEYLGADVEDFTTGATVLSAVNIPETNQVRFILDTGITLMYDYYYTKINSDPQWGTFTGLPAVSACNFQAMQTNIDSEGEVFQETAGQYIDGSNPVLIKFKTGPLRLGDLQNYQRAFFFYLLGTYLSPHKLVVNIYYDYEQNPSQSIIIAPVNYSTPYGAGVSQSPYGQGNPYGGGSNIENWRVFLQRQRCMAFALEIIEVFDPSFGTTPGAGLTLSGINLVMGFKKGFRPQSAAETAG